MNICRSKDGFIKLHYKIQDSDLWRDNNALVVFLRMLGYAHYEDDFTSIRFGGEQVFLKRGEFSATLRELSEMVNMPLGTLRHVLVRLENDERVDTRSDNRITIFRICNYSKYQDVQSKRKANDWTNDWTNATEGKKKERNKEYNTMSNSTELDAAHLWICELFRKSPTRFKLTTKRKQKIKLRMAELGKERFKQAFLAISESPHHRGDNDRGWKVDDDPYWLIDNAERAEKWANKHEDQSTVRNIDLTKVEIGI